jgi:hypothetical protein
MRYTESRTFMYDLRDLTFQARLNSATKYPSIPTYHTLDPKNGMLSEPTVDFGGQVVQISEKIDGTNARIIVMPDGRFVIGSRENLLSCSEDWFKNPELGIVEELWDTAMDLAGGFMDCDDLDPVYVYFFEVYGGNIGQNAKQYTTDKKNFDHRLFDVIKFSGELFTDLMGLGREEIAYWRDHGRQPFLGWDEFLAVSQEMNLVRAPVADRRFPADMLPKNLQHTVEWMRELLPGGSEARVDMSGQGRAEGVVLKSHDRRITAKLRFEDYEKTLRRIEKDRLKAGLVE